MDGHLRGSQRRDQLASGKRRVGGVGVAAVELDLALLVGLRALVAHGLERLRREAGHGEPVLHEQPVLGLALDVVLLAEAHAHGGQLRVVGVHAGHARHGHEEVRAQVADLGLDRALLVPRVGVAEREGEVVVRRERGEQLGGAHLLADPASDAGRVVEHDAAGNAADGLEHVAQGLADAFGVLPGEHLGDPHVRVREREHEVAQAPPDPAHVEIGLAEVGLRLAGLPGQVEEVVVLPDPELGLQRPDVLAHGRLAALDALLVAEPRPYAVGGVALLAPFEPVLLEPARDERPPWVEQLGARRRDRDARREVVLRQMVVHRVARYPDLAGDLGYRIALLPQLAYRIRLRHADHPFLPPWSNTCQQ